MENLTLRCTADVISVLVFFISSFFIDIRSDVRSTLTLVLILVIIKNARIIARINKKTL